MKKTKMGGIGLAALTLMLGMMPGQAATRSERAQSYNNKAMGLPAGVVQAPSKNQLKKAHGQDRHNWENPAGRFLNQRQYRKLTRQNPHLRKSKKHRGAN